MPAQAQRLQVLHQKESYALQRLKPVHEGFKAIILFRRTSGDDGKIALSAHQSRMKCDGDCVHLFLHPPSALVS